MGHECIAVDANDHGVTETALFEREGITVVKDIHCKFLVGTDGSRSSVRKLVGINLMGERKLQDFVSVHFLSLDLGQYLLHDRPRMMFLVFHPEALGYFIARYLRQGEFVLQLPYYPPQHKIQDFSCEACLRLIIKLVGRELADINIVAIKPWVMNAKTSEKFLACGNRVMLAGDAVHQLSPADGFGMNTGVQAALNLAWNWPM